MKINKEDIKTWNDWDEPFFENLKILYSKNYLYVMRRAIKKYFLREVGEVPLSGLRPNDIRMVIKKLESEHGDLSDSYKRQVCDWILKFCASAASYGLISGNPGCSISNPYALS